MHYICIYFIQYAFCRYNKLIVLNWLTRRGFLLNKKKIRLNARFLIHKHRLINFCWFFFFIVENFLKICTYRPKVSVHSSWKFKHFDCNYDSISIVCHLGCIPSQLGSSDVILIWALVGKNQNSFISIYEYI